MCIVFHVNSASIPNKEVISSLDDNNVCNTKMCVKESELMLGSMDESVDPCDDFYEFACGNFIRNTVLLRNKDSQTRFSLIKETVDSQLRSILTEEPQPTEPKFTKLAKIFVKSCMDDVTLNAKGNKFQNHSKHFIFICISSRDHTIGSDSKEIWGLAGY